MLAFLFPGQGSQAVGMGRALCERHALAREVFEQADRVLGYGLTRLCFEGPEEELRLTANAQPAILTCSVAALRALQSQTRLVPGVVAGHSLGEYSALVCAGVLAFEDAVRLVHLRGRFMQEAVPAGEGAMAAVIGAPAERVEALCREAARAGEVLSPANFNGAGQIVIAGHAAAVERALGLAKQFGGKRAVKLPVSAPFHCALMAPAATRLADELARVRFAEATVPVVTNVEATPNREGERARGLLVEQVTAPVRWEESVLALETLGVTRALEVGPGQVLAGLVKRIAKTIAVENAESPEQIAALAQQEAEG